MTTTYECQKAIKKFLQALSCKEQREKLKYGNHSASDLIFKMLLKDALSLTDNLQLCSLSLNSIYILDDSLYKNDMVSFSTCTPACLDD